MTIKIIGAGFGRTGTLSLKIALEKLGFGPCYHMYEVFQNPHVVPLWRDAMERRAFQWASLFQHYQATVDWPGAAFYRELLNEYPDAKVILSVRDPDAWYNSAYNTIYKQTKDSEMHPETWEEDDWALEIIEMLNALIWRGTFADRFDDREFAINVFRRHIDDVKATVPPEKLLIHEVKEGWVPLCQFLGLPVPEEPFPHANTSPNYRSEMLNFEKSCT